MEIKATNFIVDPRAVEDGLLRLNGAEAHHLTRVLRARPGDIFYAIDGLGKKYRAVISTLSPRQVAAEIVSTLRLENEPLIKLTLAFGLSRISKIDFIIEKGTELGIARFWPFVSEKTIVENKPDKWANSKLLRFRKLARSATKQSFRTVVPEILPPVAFEQILAAVGEYHLALIADMTGEPTSLKELMVQSPRDILLLVGPESGLTDHERQRAFQAGFRAVKLGPRRLRAETAAVVFASLVMFAAGEL
jgi:16S rRNA (uracil1498-N3)-methyltransferase